MNRYFAIYHGMHERAPWGVAVERTAGFPKVELLMLCRTEKDAMEAANITSLGRGLQALRDQKVAERKTQTVKDANIISNHSTQTATAVSGATRAGRVSQVAGRRERRVGVTRNAAQN